MGNWTSVAESGDSGEQEEKREEKVQELKGDVSLHSFDSKLLLALGQGQYDSGKNLCMSALSVYAALSIVLPGCDKKTLEQLLKCMISETKEPSDKYDVATSLFSNLLAVSHYYNGRYNTQACRVCIANRVWVHSQYELEDEYKNLVKNFAVPLDIGKGASHCKALVDKWCMDNTNNLIQEIVSEKSFNSDFRALITNAIYFKGLFEEEFDANLTRDSAFYANCERKSEETVGSCQLMSSGKKPKAYEYCADFNGFEVVRLDYKNSTLCLVLARPVNEMNGTPIACDDLQNIKFEKVGIKLFVPKFKFEFEQELSESLKSLGIQDLFSSKQCDLSRMMAERGIFVSQVQHKCVIEVNEKGTEAAAVTAVVMTRQSGQRERCPIVRFDHPFDFFVYDYDKKVTLFAGTVCRP